MQRMPRVGGSSWSLVVPDDWTVQYDDECLTLVAPSEAEALQVSAYRKDGPVVDDDLRGLSADHLAAGVVPVGASHGDFEGLAFTFPSEDGLARQEWYLRHGAHVLFVSFTREDEGDAHDGRLLQRILGTLSATGVPAPTR
jgi:hypothetical protein